MHYATDLKLLGMTDASSSDCCRGTGNQSKEHTAKWSMNRSDLFLFLLWFCLLIGDFSVLLCHCAQVLSYPDVVSILFNFSSHHSHVSGLRMHTECLTCLKSLFLISYGKKNDIHWYSSMFAEWLWRSTNECEHSEVVGWWDTSTGQICMSATCRFLLIAGENALLMNVENESFVGKNLFYQIVILSSLL